MKRTEAGVVVLESFVAIGLSLIVLVEIFNLGAWVITRDVAHSAVDSGVRAGAREDVDPVGACTARARQVLSNALAGPVSTGATLSCGADAEQVTASLYVPLRSWLPGLPNSSTEVRAVARREGMR